MNDGRLLLHPRNPDAPLPSRDELLRGLMAVGLLGEPLETQGAGPGAGFRVGDQFLQLITFMGCSPFIQLEPPADGGTFCHLALLGPFAEARLLHGRNTRPPPCPACGRRIDGWLAQLGERSPPATADALPGLALTGTETGGTILGCEHCGTRTPLHALRWRRNAGIGRCFLEVRNVFPGEAVPVEGLLGYLESFGAGAWDYFYLT
jgi:hypothetical protein